MLADVAEERKLNRHLSEGGKAEVRSRSGRMIRLTVLYPRVAACQEGRCNIRNIRDIPHVVAYYKCL